MISRNCARHGWKNWVRDFARDIAAAIMIAKGTIAITGD
jgi:hypothetical protein